MLIPKGPPPKGPPRSAAPVPVGPRRVVVDGSNLATEGRSVPSLVQLDEAVRAYRSEHTEDEMIVVVDASFGYRIDPSELAVFEGAEEAGEIVSPPAGAIGRGDGFLLRIADRIDAVVLSNDSFQEFHGEYQWLFDEGRLIGGKPVPAVGWIFTPRTPVRGPKSRVAVRDAKAARRKQTEPAAEPVEKAIAAATAEAVAPGAPRAPRRGSRRPAKTPEAINDPLPFITFIADHHLGTEVEGTVDTFTSHGAFVVAAGARCYAPVSGLGDPPPRSAKDVLKRGETRAFVVQALDPPRRGIELALPGLARISGAPTDETVEAEIDVGAKPARTVKKAAPRKAATKKTATATKAAAKELAPEKTAAAKKATPKKAPVAKKAVAKKVPAARKAAAAKKAPAKKAPAKKAPSKKAALAKKAATKKVTAPKKAPAKKTAAKRTTAAKKAAKASPPAF
ncbi:MAG: NYN domain-containing protein [Acidimicrobiales bacterium]